MGCPWPANVATNNPNPLPRPQIRCAAVRNPARTLRRRPACPAICPAGPYPQTPLTANQLPRIAIQAAKAA